MTSIFTRIIEGEIPATVEYEDDEVIAIRDIHPKAPTHLLFIAKKQIPNVQSMEEGDFPYLTAIFKAIRKVTEKMGIKDFRLVMNNGKGAGQSVFHLHIHLLAGKSFDEAHLGM